MPIESATKGAAELTGTGTEIHKIGKFSRKHHTFQKFKQEQEKAKKGLSCYFCGYTITIPIKEHIKICKAKKATCSKCNKVGHYQQACRSKQINDIDEEEIDMQKIDIHEEFHATIFEIGRLQTIQNINNNNKDSDDFIAEVLINNTIGKVLIDTGAKVSACGLHHAKQWGLIEKMYRTTHKIKPYNSPPLPVIGISQCAVTHGKTSIPVKWYIIEEAVQPILAGKAGKALGLIKIIKQESIYTPINMIEKADKDKLQEILNILRIFMD